MGSMRIVVVFNQHFSFGCRQAWGLEHGVRFWAIDAHRGTYDDRGLELLGHRFWQREVMK